jgi:hypothetical protein
MSGHSADSPTDSPAIVPLDGRLDSVWEEIISAEGPVPRPRLRSLLREVSVHARREKLQPEQLIIFIKQSWARTVESRPHDRQHATQTLSDVVSVCISEYFREE